MLHGRASRLKRDVFAFGLFRRDLNRGTGMVDAHLEGAQLHRGLLNYPASDPKHISPLLFRTIAAGVMEQCDGQDSLADGIISDPHGCNFDSDTLLCIVDSDPAACLTPGQLITPKKLYTDWIGDDGAFIFAGATLGIDPTFLLGSGLDATLWNVYYMNWVYNDTEWDHTQFTYKDVLFTDTVDPGARASAATTTTLLCSARAAARS